MLLSSSSRTSRPRHRPSSIGVVAPCTLASALLLLCSASCSGSEPSSDDSLVDASVRDVGGDPQPTESAHWNLTPVSYIFAQEVEDRTGFGVYRPDEGYYWLLIDVEMTNLHREDNCLNWLIEDFDYLGSDGNRYGLRLAYNDPRGYLDTCYGPQQTKPGFVAFEVVPSMIDFRTAISFSPVNSL